MSSLQLEVETGVGGGVFIEPDSWIRLLRIDFPVAVLEIDARPFRVMASARNGQERACLAEPYSRKDAFLLNRAEGQTLEIGRVAISVENIDSDLVQLLLIHSGASMVETEDEHYMATACQMGTYPVGAEVFWVNDGKGSALYRGTVASWTERKFFGWTPSLVDVAWFGKPPWKQRIFPETHWHQPREGAYISPPSALALCESELVAIESAPRKQSRSEPSSRKPDSRRRESHQ